MEGVSASAATDHLRKPFRGCTSDPFWVKACLFKRRIRRRSSEVTLYLEKNEDGFASDNRLRVSFAHECIISMRNACRFVLDVCKPYMNGRAAKKMSVHRPRGFLLSNEGGVCSTRIIELGVNCIPVSTLGRRRRSGNHRGGDQSTKSGKKFSPSGNRTWGPRASSPIRLTSDPRPFSQPFDFMSRRFLRYVSRGITHRKCE